MRQVILVALISINIFSLNNSISTQKELSLFSDIMLLFLNGYHDNNKISQSYFRGVKLFIHKISC